MRSLLRPPGHNLGETAKMHSPLGGPEERSCRLGYGVCSAGVGVNQYSVHAEKECAALDNGHGQSLIVRNDDPELFNL